MPELSTRPLLLAVGAVLLASCGSPPKLPTADEGNKRPANTAGAIDLQTCRSDLQNTRIRATEIEHAAEAASAASARAAATRSAALQATRDAQRNSVYTVLFDFGSTAVHLAESDATRLAAEARAAPLVVLHGRTDGTVESSAESRIARERAAAIRDYLVHAGVDPSRIRATYQSVGDPLADNTTESGRALNRRVEIEVYPAIPSRTLLSAAPSL